MIERIYKAEQNTSAGQDQIKVANQRRMTWKRKENSMSNKTKKWLKAAGVRAVKTMAQTAVSLVTVGNAVTDMDWIVIIEVSVTAGIVSVLTSVAGLPECKK